MGHLLPYCSLHVWISTMWDEQTLRNKHHLHTRERYLDGPRDTGAFSDGFLSHHLCLCPHLTGQLKPAHTHTFMAGLMLRLHQKQRKSQPWVYLPHYLSLICVIRIALHLYQKRGVRGACLSVSGEWQFYKIYSCFGSKTAVMMGSISTLIGFRKTASKLCVVCKHLHRLCMESTTANNSLLPWRQH